MKHMIKSPETYIVSISAIRVRVVNKWIYMYVSLSVYKDDYWFCVKQINECWLNVKLCVDFMSVFAMHREGFGLSGYTRQKWFPRGHSSILACKKHFTCASFLSKLCRGNWAYELRPRIPTTVPVLYLAVHKLELSFLASSSKRVLIGQLLAE